MSATRADADPVLAPPRIAPPQDLLPRMEVGKRGRRLPDGTVAATRATRPGNLLFGPFLRLPAGRYRLSLRARAARPRLPDSPVLGIEVIAVARLQRAWVDATAAELAAAPLDCTFTLPPDLATGDDRDIPFEFRVWHLANADIAVEAFDLTALPDDDPSRDTPRRWRLLGRLHPSWLLPHRGGGTLAARTLPLRRVAMDCSPRLRLAAGAYRLSLRAPPGPATDRPALRAELRARDESLRTATFTDSDLRDGTATLDVTLPPELALDASAGHYLDVRLTRLRTGAPPLAAVNLERVAPAEAATGTLPNPALGATARANLVVVGNCQAGMLADVFGNDEALRRRFATRYHHHALPDPLRDAARGELEAADIVLMQDIRDNEAYPLRDEIPPGARLLHFPCLRLASPWPFDAYNGAGDPEARAKDHPNYEFTYFDGLLARLRREIPDPEARFAAYRDLKIKGVVDPIRLHRLEERRLLAMDKAHGGGAGAAILDRLRREQVFYTTGHPGGRVFGHLLDGLLGTLDVKERVTATATLDSLRTLQVPVHPVVAERLGLRWAGPATTYLYRGEPITWETYVRRYIAHYG